MASGWRFKGTVEVRVDADLLEAVLVLSREGDLEYDEGAFVRVLADAGVTQAVDLDALGAAVAAFVKARQPRTEVVAARGTAPTPPQAESLVWEDLLPPPPEAAALWAQVAKAAGPPDVHHVRLEKVKVQKRVGTKVETVVETREVREKVLVDAAALSLHWVEAGTLVARVLPPKAGQPGTNLGGKTLPAPAAKAAPLLLGANLDRRKAEVWTQTSGVLRIGRTWADLVPHRPSFWDVTTSEDRTTAYLTFEPGDKHATVPRAQAILDRLAEAGIPAERTPRLEAVQALLDEAASRGQGFRAKPLGPDRDGRFHVRFNADRTKAFLDLEKPLGAGAAFSLKDLGTALREARLQGLKFDEVKAAVQAFLAGPDTELRDYLLAEGTPPTRGADRQLRFTVSFLAEDQLAEIRRALAADPTQEVPGRERLAPEAVTQAGPVRADQELAQLESPAGGEGTAGVDVTGQPVAPVPGNEPALELLAHVRKVGSGLVADIDGLMETAEVNGVRVVRVRPHLDALAAVQVAEDGLSASLTLVQGRGTGRRLSASQIDAALASAGVVEGIDEAALTAALAAAEEGAKVEGWVVARGRPAAGDLTRRLTFAPGARTGAGGVVRCPVKAGEVAATYLVPTSEVLEGLDVLGRLIPSPEETAPALVVGPDFDVEEGEVPGTQALRAQVGGELVFDGTNLTLVTKVAVAAVGGQAGNVKFPGEVMVTGGIATGGWVMAGNLKVKGRVGGALLSSDLNIQVADGIHGEGKAVLRAKNHVSVGFVERSLIMAVGDVHIGKTALGCTFRVNGTIRQEFAGGGLQGGLTKVRLGLDVRNLGSPSGTPTLVSFGQDYLIEDQIQAEMKETDKLREAIVQLDVLMRKLTTPADRDRLTAARKQKVVLMKMLDKRNLKLINLRDKFELHVPSQILVRETLYPGVSIESHGRIYEPRSRRTAVKLLFNEQTGHIEEFPLTE